MTGARGVALSSCARLGRGAAATGTATATATATVTRQVATLSTTAPLLGQARARPSRFSHFFFGRQGHAPRPDSLAGDGAGCGPETDAGRRTANEEAKAPAILAFQRAVDAGDVAAVHRTYKTLRAHLESAPPRSAPEHIRHDIRTAVRMLLSTKRAGKRRAITAAAAADDDDDHGDGDRDHLDEGAAEDARLALRMFEDMPRLLGHTYGPLDCHYAVRALAAQVPRLSRMPSPPSPSPPPSSPSSSLPSSSSSSSSSSLSPSKVTSEGPPESTSDSAVAPREVLHYLVELRRRFPVFQTRSADWALVLDAFRRRRDAWGARLAWRMQRRTATPPEALARDLYMAVLLGAGQVRRALRLADETAFLAQLAAQRTDSLAFFLNGIARIPGGAHRPEAARVADEVQRRLLQEGSDGGDIHAEASIPAQRSLWHALLIHKSLADGADAALELAQRAIATGKLRPTAETYAVLLQAPGLLASVETDDDAAAVLSRLSSLLGVAADKRAYAIAMRAILGQSPSLLNHSSSSSSSSSPPLQPSPPTPGQIREADVLYQRALGAIDGPPDNALVHPLLLAYTSSYLPSLSRALQLYDAVPDPDLGLYNALLSACAQARDMASAKALLARGGRRQRPFERLDAKSRLAQLILLLKASQSYDEAFDVYEAALRAVVPREQHDMDDGGRSTGRSSDAFGGPAGWLVILDTFSKLRLASARKPPAEMVMSIVDDMRHSGVELGAKAYTTLLDYFSKAATSLLQQRGTVADGGPASSDEQQQLHDELESLRRSIIAIHSILQRSTWIQPDMPLLTALMDAYNRVGLFDRGLDIWNRLVLARAALGQSTLAVLMDLCGRAAAGAHNSAGRFRYEGTGRRAWKSGRAMLADGAAPNKGAWDAYVEFLCRVGRLEEAVDVVLGDMAHAGARPDAKTIGMILRFGAEAKTQRRRDAAARLATTNEQGPWHRTRDIVRSRCHTGSDEDRLWWSQVWESVKRIGE